MWGVPGLPTFCWNSFPLFLRCQVWGVPGLPTFCWTSFPLFLRCQVWGVPGLPTFCWTSFPLSLRCQVWGVPGLPTFFGPHIPCSWGARCGEYLVCQHFVGPHFPYFWGARFGEYLVCQLFIGPHQRHAQQHWPPHSIELLFFNAHKTHLHKIQSICSANISLDLISSIFEVPGLGSALCANFFVGPHIPLFLRVNGWVLIIRVPVVIW